MKFLAETFKLFKSILFTEAWRAWWSCPTCKLTRQYSGDLKIVTERVYNSLPTRLHYTLTVLACLSFSLLVTTRWASENFHNVTMRWGASCWELSIVISWNRSWILVHHCAYIQQQQQEQTCCQCVQSILLCQAICGKPYRLRTHQRHPWGEPPFPHSQKGSRFLSFNTKQLMIWCWTGEKFVGVSWPACL